MTDAGRDALADAEGDRFVIDARPFVCGNGVLEGNEECDLGAQNVERPAFLVTQAAGISRRARPIVRPRSIEGFYDFYSASSHTGFEAIGESRVYLYADSLSHELSLVLTHGIDSDTSGLFQPFARVNMDITGVPASSRIAVADDRASEFFSSGPSSIAGRWQFEWNSDGGAIGGLPFPGAWKITVTPSFLEGITRWALIDTDLSRVALAMKSAVTIEAFDARSACRTDCTVPRCGDGILDGGEVCDDGNQTGGDGCSADCRTF